MKPWWHIILDKRFGRGPTIPYLVATSRLARGDDAMASVDAYREDLLALLIGMRDEAPENHCVAIELCPGLNALIARARTQPPTHMPSIVSPNDRGRALYYLNGIALPQRDIESLHAFLWREHRSQFLAGKLNRRLNNKGTDYVWGIVTQRERRAILATLRNPSRRTWPDH
jgi:hypothetical protein